jgi:hypothetical protein
MGRDHFAQYAKSQPQDYKAFSDNLWNSFVTVTHAIGLSPYFSFTPEFLEGLNGEAIGEELGKVYNNTISDDEPI